MKKTIVSLVAIAVLVPNISFAQVSAETENALLRQIVSLLTQQVQLLQSQITQLTTEKNTFRTELDQLKATNDTNTSYIEEQKQITASKEQAEAERLATEEAQKEAEEAATKKKLDAIAKDGYYIECSEDGGRCIKWVSGFCFQEGNGRGAYSGMNCGG